MFIVRDCDRGHGHSHGHDHVMLAMDLSGPCGLYFLLSAHLQRTLRTSVARGSVVSCLFLTRGQGDILTWVDLACFKIN
jgi:hypothetical protein